MTSQEDLSKDWLRISKRLLPPANTSELLNGGAPVFQGSQLMTTPIAPAGFTDLWQRSSVYRLNAMVLGRV